ncbi:Maf family protein, partial [Mitsuokella jalaludinii]
MFILASASPRRRELLQQIDASFEVKVSSVEEVTGGNLLQEFPAARRR